MNQPFDTKCAQLDDLLGVGRSFDMVSRELYVGGRRAKMWVVNGYAKDMLLERAVEKLQEVETLDGISGVDELLRRYITVCDAGTSRDRMPSSDGRICGQDSADNRRLFRRYSPGRQDLSHPVGAGAGCRQGPPGQPRRLCGEHYGKRRPSAPAHPGSGPDIGADPLGRPAPNATWLYAIWRGGRTQRPSPSSGKSCAGSISGRCP